MPRPSPEKEGGRETTNSYFSGISASIKYNNLSLTYNQLLSKINSSTGANDTSYSKADKTVDLNLALDEALAIIFQQGGVHHFDDGNHTADPIITADLVSGQRDYHFTTDEQSNVILDVYRVLAKNSSSGKFKSLDITDMARICPDTLVDGDNTTGVPTKFASIGNGIFLDLIPSYNSTGGLKMIISRQASYFVTTDTTKVAGIDGLCHDFLYLKPAYEYARNHNLSIREALYRDLQVAIQKIKDRYKIKERNVVHRMTPFVQDNR